MVFFADGRSSRSGSQHRSNDGTNTPPQRPAPPATPKVQQPPAEPVETISDELLERRLKNIIEEYHKDCSGINEVCEDFKDSIPSTAFSKVVAIG